MGSRAAVSSRFVSNLLILAAGFLVVTAAFAFRHRVDAWIAFGAGCAVACLTLVVFPMRGRGPAQRMLDVWLVAIAAWMIVSSRTFHGVTVKWMSTAEGAALVAGAALALVLREVMLLRALRRPVASPVLTGVPAGADEREPLPAR